MSESYRPTRTANDRRQSGPLATNEQCAQCGGRVETEEWHPVSTERDGDGQVEIHDFCSEECQQAWTDREQD